MSPVTLLIIGFLVYAVGFYDVADSVTEAFTGKSASSSGYPEIPLPRFLMGAGVAAMPLLLDLDESAKKQYVMLVLLSFAIYNYRGIEKFSVEIRQLFNAVYK